MKKELIVFVIRLYRYVKQDMVYDILDISKHFNLKRKYLYLKKRIQNLLYFLPIIWSDRWFDSHYLYVLIRAKLIQMEHNFRNFSMCSDGILLADEIKEVIEDLTKLIDEEIESEEYNTYYNKFPECKITIGRNWLKQLNKPKSEESITYFREMSDRIYNKQNELRLKIFTSIAINSPKWWD
jgi:hypothetical protein